MLPLSTPCGSELHFVAALHATTVAEPQSVVPQCVSRCCVWPGRHAFVLAPFPLTCVAALPPPPRALCDRLSAVLLRDRTPPCVACPAAAFAAFRAVQALHPPARCVEKDHHLALLVNPSAWSPIDTAERIRGGGAAAMGVDAGGGGDAMLSSMATRAGATARRAAHTTGSDWDQLARLTELVANATGGHGRPAMTSGVAGKVLGARLLFMHTAAVLCDDVASRLKVFPAARAACGKDARQLYSTAALWRLYDVAGSSVFRTRFIHDLVAIIEAGAAPPEDTASSCALPVIKDVSSDEEAEEGRNIGGGSQGGDGDGHAPGGTPNASQEPASQGGGIGHGLYSRTPPGSTGKTRPVPLSQAARQQEEAAVAAQMAAADGFPTPGDVGNAATRLLSALLDILSCAEDDKWWGGISAGAPPSAAAGAAAALPAGGGTRSSGLDNWRASLDDVLADAWLHSAKARGSAAHGGLLATMQGPAHVLRLARVLVARTAHVSYSDAGALRAPLGPSPCADAAALLAYVTSRASDVVRGQRCGGGAATTGRAAAKTALLLSHAVQAACVLDTRATAASRGELVQHLERAEQALRAEHGVAAMGGLHPTGAAALRVARVCVLSWARQATA